MTNSKLQTSAQVSLRRRNLCIAGALGFGQLAFGSSAYAADFPARPVRFVDPGSAGGGIDNFARTLAQQLSKTWGQPVIVENRPGAGGTLGPAAVAKSPADGHTLLVASNQLAIAQAVYANLPYDTRRDFIPVTMVATSPMVLAVRRSSGIASVADLVTRAKSMAGKQNYGSGGVGTLAHLIGEEFIKSAGISAVHVPYKGATPSLNALLAGEIDWYFSSGAIIMPHDKAGTLRALAIPTARRAPQYPALPTMTESGISMDWPIWLGLLAPAGTPDAVVRQLEKDIAQALRDESLRTAMIAAGWDVTGTSSAEFSRFLNGELDKLGQAARAANLKPE